MLRTNVFKNRASICNTITRIALSVFSSAQLLVHLPDCLINPRLIMENVHVDAGRCLPARLSAERSDSSQKPATISWSWFSTSQWSSRITLVQQFNNYFKLITDVHSYNTRQVKTRQFALPKARSNSGAKMIKYSAMEIWSKIPPEIKNKTCLALFLAEYKKYVLLNY